MLGKVRRGVDSTSSGRFYGMGQKTPRLRLGKTDSGVVPGEALGLGVCLLGGQGLSAVIHEWASPSGLPPGWTGPARGWRATTPIEAPAGLSTLWVQVLGPAPGPWSRVLVATEDRGGMSTGDPTKRRPLPA